MAKKMSWKECVEQEIITESIPDLERSKQTLEMANIRLEFWDKKIPEKYPRLQSFVCYCSGTDW